jgi:hypothetical protein
MISSFCNMSMFPSLRKEKNDNQYTNQIIDERLFIQMNDLMLGRSAKAILRTT